MSGPVHRLTAAALALALVVVPTGTLATSPATIPQPTPQQASAALSTNPWITLSAMSGSSSSALAATTAAQDDGDDEFPPIAPLLVMLGTFALGVWILVHENDDNGGERGVRGSNGFGEAMFPGQQFVPVSPA